MTKIVRTSLGLPTLRAGPQFRNSKPVLVIKYWNLRFVCNLVLGICYFTILLWGQHCLPYSPVLEIPEKMDKQFNPLEKRIFNDSFIF